MHGGRSVARHPLQQFCLPTFNDLFLWVLKPLELRTPCKTLAASGRLSVAVKRNMWQQIVVRFEPVEATTGSADVMFEHEETYAKW